ncbi:hypothetical protein LTR53_000043 [Teratosphaeriaceae sp. CCFEE 6253]|nr:hypothetical protein LTR53_000043 [Teratosphaeriaceae sp. CCFEE 6253]
MSRYAHESPMDFEFQNGTGPMDGRSPFAQFASQNAQRFVPSSRKRNYDTYDSPPKSATHQPASPFKALPPTPAFNALFNTPRKTAADIDDSSAGETPRSPEQNNDSDATPDRANLRSALGRVEAASMPAQPGAERPSPHKANSWITTQLIKAKTKFASPGRGEITRVDHTSGMERRVEKRRKREINRKESRRRRHSMSDSASDDDDDAPRSRHTQISSPRKTSAGSQHQHPLSSTTPPQRKEHWLATLYTFLESHPTIPHILSWYAQLAFNLFLLTSLAYLLATAYRAFAADVDKRAHDAMADVLAEMAACAHQFTANRCARGERVPAMEIVCEGWAKCMTRDPARVGRAKVSAGTLAEIFNSFVEPISYKAMVFTCVLVFGCFGISNFAFGLLRKTEAMGGAGGGYPPQGYYPPPTPQRSFSGRDQEGLFEGGVVPWHQGEGGGLEPLPSGAGGYGGVEGRGSPVRTLQF